MRPEGTPDSIVPLGRLILWPANPARCAGLISSVASRPNIKHNRPSRPVPKSQRSSIPQPRVGPSRTGDPPSFALPPSPCFGAASRRDQRTTLRHPPNPTSVAASRQSGVLDCGGKRSATPLSHARAELKSQTSSSARKRCRHSRSATALQDASRSPCVSELREASGLRHVHRRFSPERGCGQRPSRSNFANWWG
jgi:hypothetical protein